MCKLLKKFILFSSYNYTLYFNSRKGYTYLISVYTNKFNAYFFKEDC